MIYNIPTHVAGDTWLGINSITISSSSNPINLQGAEVFFELKSYYNHASPIVLELSNNDNTIEIINTNTIRIPPVIIDIPVGSYRYSLKVKTTSLSKTYMQGKWDIVNYIDPRLATTSPSPSASISTVDLALDVGDMQTLSVVVVDPNSSLLLSQTFSFLSENSAIWQDASTNVESNSSAYFNYEEVEDLNTVQSLTSTWLNSSSFTQNFSTVLINASTGIVDGGLF